MSSNLPRCCHGMSDCPPAAVVAILMVTEVSLWWSLLLTLLAVAVPEAVTVLLSVFFCVLLSVLLLVKYLPRD